MCGTGTNDALMQLAHELEISRLACEALCRDKTALEERVAVLEKENVRLKLHYLKNQLQVTGVA
jgi:hypothetical protein